MPQIKEEVTRAVEVAQKAMGKMDMKSVSGKIQKAVQVVKNKIDNLKKSTENNEVKIKINNKEAEKQISQLEKEIDSLQKKINARQMKLDIINPQMDKIVSDTRNEVVPEGIVKNDKSMDEVVNNALSSNKDFTTLDSQAQKLYTEIEMYNKQLDEAKSKMSQLKQEVNQTSASQGKMTSFFNAFKGKIEQAKTSVNGMKVHFNQIPKITQNITNNIKKMSNGVKAGLGHVLKYAGALFSLRGIYSVLSNSARSWLSSQNEQAQQLSANIEYMKHAMGSAFAPVIEYVVSLIYQLMRAVQSLVYAFSGINIFAKATASSMNNVASNTKKSKKEAQGLSSIHSEISNLQSNDNSDTGGSGTISPSFDLSQMENVSSSILDAIKSGDWYEVGSLIGEKLNEAMDNIPWNKIQDTARNIGKNIALLLNGFIGTTDWKKVGGTIAEGLNTAIYFAYEFVTTFDWSRFGTAIGNSINGFVKKIDTKTLGKTISSVINGAVSVAVGIIETTEWSELGYAIGNTIGTSIANIDWVNIGRVIVEGFGSLEDALKGIGQGIIDGIFVGMAEKMGGAEVGQFIGALFKLLLDLIKHALGIHSPSTVMRDEVGIFMGLGIIEGFKSGLSNIWESVSSIFTNLIKNITQVWEDVKEGAKRKWEEIKGALKTKWEEIKTSVSEKFNSVGEKVSTTWEAIKTNASTAWETIKTTLSTKWETIKTTISTKWDSMKTKVSNTWETIKTNTSTKWNTIKTTLSTTWDNVKRTASTKFENIKTTISTTWENIKTSASTWGKDLVDNMASGIQKNISKVTSAAKSVANNVKSFLGFSEPEKGPLSNFHTYMPDMIDLMVQGIHNNMGKVTTELENLTGTMSYTINTPDINPISIDTNIDKSKIQPQNIMLETLSEVFANNEGNTNITIPLSLYVGNQKLGQILLEDLRNMKRQTGQGIEALVGG